MRPLLTIPVGWWALGSAPLLAGMVGVAYAVTLFHAGCHDLPTARSPRLCPIGGGEASGLQIAVTLVCVGLLWCGILFAIIAAIRNRPPRGDADAFALLAAALAASAVAAGVLVGSVPLAGPNVFSVLIAAATSFVAVIIVGPIARRVVDKREERDGESGVRGGVDERRRFRR